MARSLNFSDKNFMHCYIVVCCVVHSLAQGHDISTCNGHHPYGNQYDEHWRYAYLALTNIVVDPFFANKNIEWQKETLGSVN